MCDLTLSVKYSYERLDGEIVFGTTNPPPPALRNFRLDPLQETEMLAQGGGGDYAYRLLDYEAQFSWNWC